MKSRGEALTMGLVPFVGGDLALSPPREDTAKSWQSASQGESAHLHPTLRPP